jgi:putative ribosome biogenesis GTPase RsgA
VVCISKGDIVPHADARDKLAQDLVAAGLDVLWISAPTGEGLDELIERLSALLAMLAADAQAQETAQ